VAPEFILDVRPGDLFVLRNIANIVPSYGVSESGAGAAIEYAVRQLKVPNIIVLGHLDCGGIKALDGHLDMAAEPNLSRWLQWARPAQTQVDARLVADPELRHRSIVAANVRLQLRNLQTYNGVARAVESGRLALHGWVFSIGTGEFWSYDPATDAYGPTPADAGG